MKHQILKTTPDISHRMSKVRLKNGRAESMLAKALWHCGLRYRLNYKILPGSPDIAITKYKIAIFVDGEFWHGKDWAIRKLRLKNNREYWVKKVEENICRDIRNDLLLQQNDWVVFHFWEKEVLKSMNRCVQLIQEEVINIGFV